MTGVPGVWLAVGVVTTEEGVLPVETTVEDMVETCLMGFKLASDTFDPSGMLLGTLKRVHSWTASRQVCSWTVMAQPVFNIREE